MSPKRRILIDDRGGRRLAALTVNGRLQDLLIESAEDVAVGSIWTARVERPAGRSAGGGLFLDLGGGLSAFLPGGDDLAPGEALKIEIIRAAEGAKAAVASRKLSFYGERLVHTPSAPGVNISRKINDDAERGRLRAALAAFEPKGGFVLRTAARGVAEDLLCDEAERLTEEAAEIEAAALKPPRRLRDAPSLRARAERLWPDAPIVDAPEDAPPEARPFATHGIGASIAALLGPRIELSGPDVRGGWMAVERTEALVAIDVNAAAGPTQAANLAALAEAPRQLRLRGWGGQIVIDLASAPQGSGAAAEAERARYFSALRRAADPEWSVLGFGPLGLLEARRRRDRPAIESALRRTDFDEDA